MRPEITLTTILETLRSQGSRANVEGMARFGITAKKAFGVPTPALMKLAKQIGHNHQLAEQLWSSGIHDARALAVLIDSPREVTEAQMERWAKDFDNWAIVDACCGKLFDKTSLAYQKTVEWSGRQEEFVKRAGFSLMVALAVHDKRAQDRRFLEFLPIIKKASGDERNFVKKAVNWALRTIGKRNLKLNDTAIRTARALRLLDSRSARWIAADALRELKSEAVQRRLRDRAGE